MPEQVLEIKDFSGGITDNYVGGDVNKFQYLTNTVIRSDRKPDQRPAGILLDATDNQLPGGSTKRGDSAYRFKDNNIYQQENKLYFVDSGFNEIVGPTSNSAFSTSTVEFDQCSYAEWNNHLLVTSDRREKPKFIIQNGLGFDLYNIGLPQPSIGSVSFSAGVGHAREYAFVYCHTYTIDGVEYQARSKPAYKEYTGNITNSITSLPVLSNGSTNSYATTSIKLEIYRTADASDTHYKVGEVTNGTTTFSDTTADADLDAGLLLYTDADDLDYDEPPECKYLIQLGGVVYYLNIKDSLGAIYPNRIVQAAPDQIYAANEGNTTDVDGDITGGGVAGQYPIIFTANKTYRLEGIYDSTGRGGSLKVEVSRTVGCISHKSIIQTQEGLFFAAKDGFYFTDGFKVMRISEEFNSRYSASVANATIQKLIYGAYDPVNKRLHWSACSDSDQTDINSMYVAHLYWGLSPSTPFTQWDGGAWADNFAPTSLLFYNDQLVATDKRGYLLKFLQSELNDIKIDTAVATTTWTYLPVIYDIRTAAFDFGDVTNRKWVPKMTAYAHPVSRVSFRLSSNNDNSGIFHELAEVKSNTPVTWQQTPDPVWRDSTVRWDYTPIVSGERRFPKPIRCSYKQIRVSNSYTLVDDSARSGTVTVDATAKTVTLNTSGFEWDDNIAEYYISFADDSYVNEYRVISKDSATVITVEDTNSFLVSNTTASYKLYGYRKTEALRLLSLAIIYQATSPTQSPPEAAS